LSNRFSTAVLDAKALDALDAALVAELAALVAEAAAWLT
jgi:hypothetical protein